MKNYFHIFLVCFIIVIHHNYSQTLSKENIYITISRIPKIAHKTVYSKNSYKIDKSATISYNTYNNPIKEIIGFDTITRTISSVLDIDTLFLKVRYNPGKHANYILRRGDIAKIEYVFDIPYLTLENREPKKHDIGISEKINELETKQERNKYTSYNFKMLANKSFKEKRAQQEQVVYNNILKTLDSLYKYDLLSKPEFYYYKKYASYKKLSKANIFDVRKLKNNDLYISSYQVYLRQYVFQNLKKKIISLGNGMARNSLEAFDFAFKSNSFSASNKKFLLSNYLRNIKLDFPRKTYLNRLEKYKKLYPDHGILVKKSKKIQFTENELNNVLLIDDNYSETTLKNVLNKYKGSAIYIDFWTSWCAPCRAAFPSYKKLKEKYKNNPIVFLFISGDSDEIKWKTATEKERLQNSFLATNFGKPNFYKKLRLTSFPRYLLFDKNGKLVNDKVAAPDSDNITLFLDEILAK